MREIVRIRFGSQLYGTDTPASDQDFKSVHLPEARDILLGRAAGSIVKKTKDNDRLKNLPTDVDDESYSLQRFLQLLLEGQTTHLDMLFAPPDFILSNSPLWAEIVASRDRLLSRQSTAFVGYCRTQANKYGIKGSRVAAARLALKVLEEAIEDHGRQAKLAIIKNRYATLCLATEHMAVGTLPPVKGVAIPYWEVCNRKLCDTAHLGTSYDCIKKMVDEYGQRAIAAEAAEGIDWKALSRAVRVGCEAIELLQSHTITFPLPDRNLIRDIKLGKMPYKEVAGIIEGLLEDVEKAAERSDLPAKPDYPYAESIVFRTYGQHVALQFPCTPEAMLIV